MEELIHLLQDTVLRLEKGAIAQLLADSPPPALPWRPWRGLPAPEPPGRSPTESPAAAAVGPDDSAPSGATPSSATPAAAAVDWFVVATALLAALRECACTGLRTLQERATQLLATVRAADAINTPLAYGLNRLQPTTDLLRKSVDVLLALALAGPRCNTTAATEADVLIILEHWHRVDRTALKVDALLQMFEGVVNVFAPSKDGVHKPALEALAARPSVDPNAADAASTSASSSSTVSLLRALDTMPRVTVTVELDRTVARSTLRKLWREAFHPQQPIVSLSELIEALATFEPATGYRKLDLRPDGLLAARLCCLPGLVTFFQLDDLTQATTWKEALEAFRHPDADAGTPTSSSRSNSIAAAGDAEHGLPGSVPATPTAAMARLSLSTSTPQLAGGGAPLSPGSPAVGGAAVASDRRASAASASAPRRVSQQTPAQSELATYTALPLEAIVPSAIKQRETIQMVYGRLREQLAVLDEALGDAEARQLDWAALARSCLPEDHCRPVLQLLEQDFRRRTAADDDRRKQLHRLAADLLQRHSELELELEVDRFEREAREAALATQSTPTPAAASHENAQDALRRELAEAERYRNFREVLGMVGGPVLDLVQQRSKLADLLSALLSAGEPPQIAIESATFSSLGAPLSARSYYVCHASCMLRPGDLFPMQTTLFVFDAGIGYVQRLWAERNRPLYVPWTDVDAVVPVTPKGTDPPGMELRLRDNKRSVVIVPANARIVGPLTAVAQELVDQHRPGASGGLIIAVEETFEYERRWPLGGYSAANFLMRDNWKDARGSTRTRESVRVPNAEWQWASTWQIAPAPHADENGWERAHGRGGAAVQYAATFDGNYGPASPLTFFRRRKWIRHRIRTGSSLHSYAAGGDWRRAWVMRPR